MKQRAWSMYLALGGGIGLLYFFGPRFARAGTVFNLVGCSSVIAVAIGIRLHSPKARLPWFLFALGLGMFLCGDIITYNPQWFYGTGVTSQNIPFPSVGDLFYLLVYPALVTGVLVLIRKRSPGRDTAALIDSTIVTIGIGVLSWVYLMAPYAHDASSTATQKLTSIAYPLGDLLLLGAIVRLAVGRGKRVPAFYLLMASAMTLLVTDAAYGVIRTFNLYGGSGSLLDAGWGAFYLLWGAAALHPSMSSLDAWVPGSDRPVTVKRLLLLAGASLMAPVTQAVQGFRGSDSDRVMVAAASAVLFVLVLIRLKRLMADIADHRRTEQALQEAEQKYRSLVEQLPAVIYIDVIGSQVAPMYVSPQIEAIFGIPVHGWLEDRSRYVHADDRSRVIGDSALLRSGGEPFSSEYRLVSPDGRVRWVYEEAVAVPEGKGSAVVQGVIVDVTGRKQVEDELERHRHALQSALEELSAAEADRSRLFEKTVHATEEERIRIAAELHDGPIQRFSALVFDLERARGRCDRGDVAGAKEVLEEVQEALSDSVQGLRVLMAELRPPVLSEKGIAAALRDYGADFSERSGVACTVEYDGVDTLPPQLETVLYRVTQEALTNVTKHARASSVTIDLRVEHSRIELTVTDDGVGFDPVVASTMVRGGHFGLLGMRERVEMAGGRWEVRSSKGRGSTVRAVFEMARVAA